MQQQQNTHNISVTWRGRKFNVGMTSNSTLRELGNSLQKLTDVKEDTLRLIVRSNKTSKLLFPFSTEHSLLTLQESSVLEGKSIMMMGVPKDELDQVLQNAKADMRIAGFDEEEKRLRQRMSSGVRAPLRLPQGNYIFCEFRTLYLPGIELNPPASEALKLMHRLAADPGIVAIMNKHRWRVGIMTEMAPEGYVGVSPVCILGFNKNQGEEISLRLRTDDLKGFRKYQSIKKTLLHELAHMVYSEHDANFYTLDKQLNQEASSLDWTQSRSQTLAGIGSQHHEEDFYTIDDGGLSQKLGGRSIDQLANARASSVAAAYRRLESSLGCVSGTSELLERHHAPDGVHATENELSLVEGKENHCQHDNEPETDNCFSNTNKNEPDPDDSKDREVMESEPYRESDGSRNFSEPDPDDSEMIEWVPPLTTERTLGNMLARGEPDPDDLEFPLADRDVFRPHDLMESNNGCIQAGNIFDGSVASESSGESQEIMLHADSVLPNKEDFVLGGHIRNHAKLIENVVECDDNSQNGQRTEPDPDDKVVTRQGTSGTEINEPDPDDQELQIINDPVTVACNRLKKAIEMLQTEVNPSEAVTVLQTLFKIIRNVIEHPDDMKFKKLRKNNPVIQRNVASHKAAMDILLLIGFIEDVVSDEIGKAETYLILKRNDPGLLWLAKSSLETCMSC